MDFGKTAVVLCKEEEDLGRSAAGAVAQRMKQLLRRQDEIRMVFAAGESQITFLDALALEPGINWQRVICLNMDDFWDPRLPERFTCGYQTRTQLYEKVRPKKFHLVRFNAPEPEQEAKRYEDVLRAAGKLDILCQGVGTSGHLALNEPFQTDFQDSAWVRVVEINPQSKQQLSADPNFKELGYIPDQGITMTIPALLSATFIYTMVPLALKRDILARLFSTTLPTVSLPASILRTVEGTLFIDRNSCPPGILTQFRG
jgi:glucosamine-6-phosphate deaminase